jgi:microsomal dipeptidase-like Zn-dependent dipeptidase
MGIEHVGLGADFVDQVVSLGQSPDGKASLGLEGFTRPDEYPALVEALRDRGYEGERLEAIMSENWLRVLRETVPA